jgi:lipopolysaccharide transport system ATP-binding protein
MLVKTVSGLALGAQWSAPHGEALDIVPQGMTMRVQFPINLPFAAGVYFGNAGVSGIPRGRAESIVLHRVVDAIMFRVAPIAADRMSSHVDITGGLPAQINAIESAYGSNAERQGDLAELAAKTTMKGLI